MREPGREHRFASVIGRRVRLTLVDPAAADTEEPLAVLHGRLASAVVGCYGHLRYLVELSERLPEGFDPLGELPRVARRVSVRQLLVTAAPDLPTLATPRNFIAECLVRGEVVHVFVSIGSAQWRYPFLAMGDLEVARAR